MNPLCQYCGIGDVATELNYTASCTSCVFECSTCNNLQPYELGVAGSDECDECCYASALDTTPTTPTTQQQGDSTMSRLYTVVSFDDQSKMYQVVGTTTSQIEPEELTDLLGGDTDKTDFDNVIADFINTEVDRMVALASSQQRAKKTRMNKAEHKQMFMRIGEWNSVLFALRTLREIDLNDNGVSVRSPQTYVSNGVSVEMLISIIEENLAEASGVVGNNA